MFSPNGCLAPPISGTWESVVSTDDAVGTDDWELERLLALPENRLLDLLGDQLLGAGRGVGPTDPGERRRFANSWLADWFKQHKHAVCGSPAVVLLLSEEGSSAAEDAAVLSDALAASLGRPALATVAVILAKRGIALLCTS
jgi:hypothetical protein